MTTAARRPRRGILRDDRDRRSCCQVLAEHAAKYADQPFFQYVAFISPHFPLHALPEDIARYRDKYLAGWDQMRAAALAAHEGNGHRPVRTFRG